MPIGTNESRMIKRIRRGDEHAFEELFYRYYPRLFAFALEFVNSRDLAKDMVQDVFIKFWEKRDLFREDSLSGFLFTMVRNQCLNYLRHQKMVENKKIELKYAAWTEELYRIDFIRDQPYTYIEKELNDKLDHAVKKLPPKCRKVFMMSRIEGLRNREIAEKLGFSVKNVEKHLSRALKHFRKHFNHHQLYLHPAVIILIFASPCLSL